MKNGYKLRAYPIKLENNDFPNGQDKAEAFENLFAGNSLSSNLNPSIIKFRKEEEQKEEYKHAVPKQCHYLNSPLQYDEVIETLKSFASNTTAVGIDGTSYQFLTICLIAGNSYCIHFYQKCWLTEYLEAVSNNSDSKTRQTKISNCQLQTNCTHIACGSNNGKDHTQTIATLL